MYIKERPFNFLEGGGNVFVRKKNSVKFFIDNNKLTLKMQERKIEIPGSFQREVLFLI